MKKHCVICNKEFEVYEQRPDGSKRGGVSKKNKRGVNTINCSKKCSWIYNCMNNKERKEMKKAHEKKFPEELTIKTKKVAQIKPMQEFELFLKRKPMKKPF